MYLLVVIATCLVITANGYTFQKPVRPSIVHYPMASYSLPNTGGYGGQQAWVSGSANTHPVAGTRRLQTPNARSYFPKQSYVTPNVAEAPVAAGPTAYQVQHGAQETVTVKPKRPYAPKVSAVIKPPPPKPSKTVAVGTPQPYPAVPAIPNHVPVYNPAASHSPATSYNPVASHSPVANPVRAEVAHHQSSSSSAINLPPQGWIPSYGIDITKASQNPSGSVLATGGYQQQWAKQSTGLESITKTKMEDAMTHDGTSALHEMPLQTAVLIIRKPSPKAMATPNNGISDKSPIISETMLHSNVTNDYPTHKSPTITEIVSTTPSTLVQPEVPTYHNPSIIPLTSFLPDNLPSPVTKSYQDVLPLLVPEDANLQHQPDMPVAHQLPEFLASTEASLLQTPQPTNPESGGEYILQQVSPTTDSAVPVTFGSSSGENQEVNFKNPPSDQQLISLPAISYQAPQQSAYGVSINLQSVEEIQPQIAEVNAAAFPEPSYSQQDVQQPSAQEPSTFRTDSPPSLPSFDDSVVPKYVLGPYPSLVLPEPPLALASSAYGVAQLGVDETQPIPALQQDFSKHSAGSYGLPAVSQSNVENLPLQQEWGYYSAEPFQPSSADISQTNILPSTVGSYQQTLATHQVSNPQSSYGVQRPSTSPQQSGYPFGQPLTAGSNNHYQASHQTVAAETLNNFHAAADHWISSSGEHVVGRQDSVGSDKRPVAILSFKNVRNEDGSFFYNYETEDGIKAEANGYQKQLGPDPESSGTVAKGSYSYTAPDGVKISVNWVADENGFQPTGDHIPSPAPILIDQMIAHLSASEKTAGNAVPTGWVQSTHAY